jgi:hypothetical protein
MGTEGRIVGIETRRQPEAKALVAEALEEAPLDPTSPQGGNVVRLLSAMWFVCGTLNFPRGWVREVQLAMRDADCPVPTPASCRWYRSALIVDPLRFVRFRGVDPDLLEQMHRDLDAP